MFKTDVNYKMSHLSVPEKHVEKLNITRIHYEITVYFLTIYMTHPVVNGLTDTVSVVYGRLNCFKDPMLQSSSLGQKGGHIKTNYKINSSLHIYIV